MRPRCGTLAGEDQVAVGRNSRLFPDLVSATGLHITAAGFGPYKLPQSEGVHVFPVSVATAGGPSS